MRESGPDKNIADVTAPTHSHAPSSAIGVKKGNPLVGCNPFLRFFREKRVTHRRKRLNRGGALSVQACHDMLAVLPGSKRYTGGTGNAEIAFHLDKVEMEGIKSDKEHGEQVMLEDLEMAQQESSSGDGRVQAQSEENAKKEVQEKQIAPPEAPLKPLYGPFLNYHNVDLEQNVWLGHILFVHHLSRPAPKIHVQSEVDGGRWVEPRVLDQDMCGTGYTAVRYDLRITLHDQPSALLDAAKADDPQAKYSQQKGIETGSPRVSAGKSQKVVYTVDPNPPAAASTGDGEVKATNSTIDWTAEGGKEYEFYVAAKNEPWHWSFFSCNGFGTDTKKPEQNYDGVRPMWRDKLAVHEKRPLHLMVGCGDQIYQDDLFFHCQSLRQWLDIFDARQRESYQFTQEMQVEVERYYLTHYLAHFSQPVVCDAMARIPGLNIVDDHDIFDGFGSYPEPLQQCPVFQAIGKIALRFYLLFQHHTTQQLARKEDLWGGSTGYNFVRLMGPRTAIFGNDGRFERSKNRVCDPKTWDLLFNQYLPQLPDTVEHLIFAAGVPVSFPVLGVTEKVMEVVSRIRRWSGFRKFFRFSGLYKKLGLSFGEPSNLDDLIDHWNSEFHIQERNELIMRFQEWCSKSSVRVTIIAGDVHCAAVAQLRTQENLTKKTKHVYEIPPLKDEKLMYNIISSAIGNIPPPKVVLKLFQWSSSRHPVLNVKGTTEGLVHIFQHDVDGKRNRKGHRKIMARRNWCEVDEIVPQSWVEREESGDLIVAEEVACPEIAVFRLRFEPPKNNPEIGVGVYHVSIPRLVVGEKAEKMPGLVKMAEERKEMGVGVAEMDEQIADKSKNNDHPQNQSNDHPETRKSETEESGKAQASTGALNALSTPSLFSHPEDSHPKAPKRIDAVNAMNEASDGIPLERQSPNEWPKSDDHATMHPFASDFEEPHGVNVKGKGVDGPSHGGVEMYVEMRQRADQVPGAVEHS